jgi:hypothetical protein
MLPHCAGAADFAINGRAPQAELPGGHGWRQTCLNQIERGCNLFRIKRLPSRILAASRAAPIPSLVHSAIRRRSIWTITPKRWNTSSPAAELVSILSSKLSNAALLEHRYRGEQFPERAAKAVQTDNRELSPSRA